MAGSELQPPVDAVGPKEATNDEGHDTPPALPVAPHVPPAPVPKRETHACRPDQTPWWKIGLEFGAFALGIVFSLIYHAQLAEMKRQSKATEDAVDIASHTLDATNRQFNLQNRAYLIPVDSNMKAGGYGLVKIALRNYGHTSAKDARFEGTLDRISAISSPAIREAIPLDLPIATAIIPSDVPTYTWDVFTPNYGPGFPVIGDALRVLGRVTYDDGFGHKESLASATHSR